MRASTDSEIDTAIAAVANQGAGALLIVQDTFFTDLNPRGQLVTLASRYKLPAMCPQREFVEAGGLISYAADFANGYRQAGVYIGKILKGAKPADLPVEQPTKFDLVINLKTAKALGLTVPPTLLTSADEVIE